MKRFRHLIGTSISASGGGSGTGQILIKDYDVSFYRSTLPIKGDGGITAGTNYNGVGIKLVGRLVNVALPGDISGTNYGEHRYIGRHTAPRLHFRDALYRRTGSKHKHRTS